MSITPLSAPTTTYLRKYTIGNETSKIVVTETFDKNDFHSLP